MNNTICASSSKPKLREMLKAQQRPLSTNSKSKLCKALNVFAPGMTAMQYGTLKALKYGKHGQNTFDKAGKKIQHVYENEKRVSRKTNPSTSGYHLIPKGTLIPTIDGERRFKCDLKKIDLCLFLDRPFLPIICTTEFEDKARTWKHTLQSANPHVTVVVEPISGDMMDNLKSYRTRTVPIIIFFGISVDDLIVNELNRILMVNGIILAHDYSYLSHGINESILYSLSSTIRVIYTLKNMSYDALTITTNVYEKLPATVISTVENWKTEDLVGRFQLDDKIYTETPEHVIDFKGTPPFRYNPPTLTTTRDGKCDHKERPSKNAPKATVRPKARQYEAEVSKARLARAKAQLLTVMATDAESTQKAEEATARADVFTNKLGHEYVAQITDIFGHQTHVHTRLGGTSSRYTDVIGYRTQAFTNVGGTYKDRINATFEIICGQLENGETEVQKLVLFVHWFIHAFNTFRVRYPVAHVQIMREASATVRKYMANNNIQFSTAWDMMKDQEWYDQLGTKWAGDNKMDAMREIITKLMRDNDRISFINTLTNDFITNGPNNTIDVNIQDILTKCAQFIESSDILEIVLLFIEWLVFSINTFRRTYDVATYTGIISHSRDTVIGYIRTHDFGTDLWNHIQSKSESWYSQLDKRYVGENQYDAMMDLLYYLIFPNGYKTISTDYEHRLNDTRNYRSFRINSQNITESDFKLLTGTRWYNTEIINTHMFILQQRYPQHMFISSCFISSPGIYKDQSFRGTGRDFTEIPNDIFIPVHQNGNHWQLIHISGMDITLYDSWKDNASEEPPDTLKTWLGRNYPRRFPGTFEVKNPGNMIYQPDAHSCGILAVATAHRLAARLPMYIVGGNHVASKPMVKHLRLGLAEKIHLFSEGTYPTDNPVQTDVNNPNLSVVPDSDIQDHGDDIKNPIQIDQQLQPIPKDFTLDIDGVDEQDNLNVKVGVPVVDNLNVKVGVPVVNNKLHFNSVEDDWKPNDILCNLKRDDSSALGGDSDVDSEDSFNPSIDVDSEDSVKPKDGIFTDLDDIVNVNAEVLIGDSILHFNVDDNLDAPNLSPPNLSPP